MSYKYLSVIILNTFILGIFASPALAHQCRLLKPDARNLCLAKNENKRFYCSYIKDPDQQSYCYSYLDKSPNQCETIRDETLKEQCKIEAQQRLDEALALQKAAEEAAKAKAAEEEAKAAAEEANKTNSNNRP